MGFIEETGAAQHFRDSRITAIYEGTTGIQAADLIGRKIAREGGETIKVVIAAMRAVLSQLDAVEGPSFAAIRNSFAQGVDALEQSVGYILATYGPDIKSASVGSVPFLELFGIVAGGWQMARAALVAQRRIAEGKDNAFYRTKIVTTRFYADHVLSGAAGLAYAVINGAPGALEIADEAF